MNHDVHKLNDYIKRFRNAPPDLYDLFNRNITHFSAFISMVSQINDSHLFQDDGSSKRWLNLIKTVLHHSNDHSAASNLEIILRRTTYDIKTRCFFDTTNSWSPFLNAIDSGSDVLLDLVCQNIKHYVSQKSIDLMWNTYLNPMYQIVSNKRISMIGPVLQNHSDFFSSKNVNFALAPVMNLNNTIQLLAKYAHTNDIGPLFDLGTRANLLRLMVCEIIKNDHLAGNEDAAQVILDELASLPTNQFADLFPTNSLFGKKNPLRSAAKYRRDTLYTSIKSLMLRKHMTPELIERVETQGRGPFSAGASAKQYIGS